MEYFPRPTPCPTLPDKRLAAHWMLTFERLQPLKIMVLARTVFLGKVSNEKKLAYETVLSAQQKAVDQLKMNKWKNDKMNNFKTIEASKLDKIARSYIISQGYPSIPHSLGHGIGLEVHEKPWLSFNSEDKLQNGMVFSIEPGIYLNDKFGIRIEDLFTIQNNKLIQLTHSPKGLIEL